MSLLETDEANDQGYQEWVAGRSERIATRRQRLGSVATKQEAHIPINPQRLLEEALHANHDSITKEASERMSQADDFLASLDEILAAS
jgi:hypothetical protein